jgi:hypothetical protein
MSAFDSLDSAKREQALRLKGTFGRDDAFSPTSSSLEQEHEKKWH